MLRLPKFQLLRPESVDETVALMSEHGDRAKVIAGGTDLLPNMKHGLFEPDYVIALSNVEELTGVEVAANGALSIGAMTTLETVESHELVLQHCPGLARAANAVAGPSQRSMATLGGNVCLDTRCVWYNQTYFWRKSLGYCLKKDGTECHVVTTGTKCVAAASNDTATMLCAVDATLVIRGASGDRTVKIRDFYHGDGAFNLRLQPNELLTHVVVPPAPAGLHSGYAKLRPRHSIDFPKLSVAATFTVDGGVMQDATLVLSAIAATPRLINGVDELAKGKAPGDPEFLAAAGDLAYRRIKPLTNIDGDTDYRREMIPVYVKRAFLQAEPSRV